MTSWLGPWPKAVLCSVVGTSASTTISWCRALLRCSAGEPCTCCAMTPSTRSPHCSTRGGRLLTLPLSPIADWERFNQRLSVVGASTGDPPEDRDGPRSAEAGVQSLTPLTEVERD